jgi:hypothetical protein
MDARERNIRLKLKTDFAHYARKCLKIRTKDGRVAPFVLNEAQLLIHAALERQREATGRVRAVILKGRQQGCTTYVQGRFYWRLTHAVMTQVKGRNMDWTGFLRKKPETKKSRMGLRVQYSSQQLRFTPSQYDQLAKKDYQENVIAYVRHGSLVS